MVRSRQHLVTDTSSPVADRQPEGEGGADMAKITKKKYGKNNTKNTKLLELCIYFT